MKLLRNFILIALCLSLLGAALASCGGDDTPAETSAEASQTEAAQTEAQTTEKSVYTGNPTEGGGAQNPPPSGGGSVGTTEGAQTTDTQAGPSDGAQTTGFPGGGLELPGITP